MEDEVAAIRRHLEELENVLKQDNNMSDNLEKKYRQSEEDKHNLKISLEKMKCQLDEERQKRKCEQKKVEELQRALRKEYDTIVMIRDVLLNG